MLLINGAYGQNNHGHIESIDQSRDYKTKQKYVLDYDKSFYGHFS